MENFDTIIIGAGQAGLAISYHLTESDHEHILLEKDQLGSSWREGRWDSFTLVTPNWQLQLPGMEYDGDESNGFLPLDQIIDYLESYAASFDAPVRTGVEVRSVQRANDGQGFRLKTNQGDYAADNVVVAVGTFQQASLPTCASELAPAIEQIHSSDYKNPKQLPDGGVLVVGGGQSGCQIAEELNQAGRDVYLATSQVGRLPRRYRGKDCMRWMVELGVIDRTVDQLDSLAERFDPNPHVSGKNGGHTINLHQLSKDGVHLLGHLVSCSKWMANFAPDLKENLKAADAFAQELKKGIDNYIEETGIDAPAPKPAETDAGYQVPEQTELNLSEAGVKTVLWATGYDFDFSWVDFDIFDEYGYPKQCRGVTPEPGLYFLGLHWLHTLKSGLFLGVGEDAAHVAQDILS